jgi:hypothetical protein
MKTITRKIALLFVIITLSSVLYAQVAVNDNGALPDNSAMLDVKSTTKGALIPRMTAIQREAILNPANGLMVYCIDDNQLYINKGTPTSPGWSPATSQWTSAGSNIYYNSGNVGIGEASPAYPLNFGYALGEKISLHGAGPTHYGFGIQNFQMQMFTDASNSDISFGYGSSTAFTENVRIKGTGQVGIGTTAPGYPLSFGVDFGDKISLSPPAYPWFNHYGFGVQLNEMQIFTDAASADITFGYKSQLGFMNEKFRMKGNGRLGIGTTAPAYKLDVVGDINTNGSFRVNGVAVNLGSPWVITGSDIYYNSGTVMIGATATTANPELFVKSDSLGMFVSCDGSLLNYAATGIKSYIQGTNNTTGYLGDVLGTGTANKVKGIDLNVHGKGDLYGFYLNMNDEGNSVPLTGISMNLTAANNNMTKKGIEISIVAPSGLTEQSGESFGVISSVVTNRRDAVGGFFRGEVNDIGPTGGWTAYGIKAIAYNGNAQIPPYVANPTARGYAVYGEIPPWNPQLSYPYPLIPGTHYAGYFNGGVHIIGSLTIGLFDSKFIQNTQPVENVLAKIKQLNPGSVTYNKQAYPQMSFTSGNPIGIIAQEMEKVFPELVKNETFPEKYDDKGNMTHDAVQYKGVDYIELIPILTAGIKEQQTIIENQNTTIQDLQNQVNDLNARLAVIEKLLKK